MLSIVNKALGVLCESNYHARNAARAIRNNFKRPLIARYCFGIPVIGQGVQHSGLEKSTRLKKHEKVFQKSNFCETETLHLTKKIKNQKVQHFDLLHLTLPVLRFFDFNISMEISFVEDKTLEKECLENNINQYYLIK